MANTPRIAWDKALGIAKAGAAACEAMLRTLTAWRAASEARAKTLSALDGKHVVTEDHSLRVAAAGLQRTLRVHAAGATRFAQTIQQQCLPSLQRCLAGASRAVKDHTARKAAVEKPLAQCAKDRDKAEKKYRAVLEREQETTHALWHLKVICKQHSWLGMKPPAQEHIQAAAASSSAARPAGTPASPHHHGHHGSVAKAAAGVAPGAPGATRPGTRGTVVGLQKKPAFNGRACTLSAWDSGAGRWHVAIDGEANPIALKPGNLRVAAVWHSDASGSSGGGASASGGGGGGGGGASGAASSSSSSASPGAGAGGARMRKKRPSASVWGSTLKFFAGAGGKLGKHASAPKALRAVSSEADARARSSKLTETLGQLRTEKRNALARWKDLEERTVVPVERSPNTSRALNPLHVTAGTWIFIVRLLLLALL